MACKIGILPIKSEGVGSSERVNIITLYITRSVICGDGFFVMLDVPPHHLPGESSAATAFSSCWMCHCITYQECRSRRRLPRHVGYATASLTRRVVCGDGFLVMLDVPLHHLPGVLSAATASSSCWICHCITYQECRLQRRLPYHAGCATASLTRSVVCGDGFHVMLDVPPHHLPGVSSAATASLSCWMCHCITYQECRPRRRLPRHVGYATASLTRSVICGDGFLVMLDMPLHHLPGVSSAATASSSCWMCHCITYQECRLRRLFLVMLDVPLHHSPGVSSAATASSSCWICHCITYQKCHLRRRLLRHAGCATASLDKNCSSLPIMLYKGPVNMA